jgi:hypothetical protein
MLPRAVTFAIVGESLIRYTEEVVLPRIDATLASLSTPAIVAMPAPRATSSGAAGAVGLRAASEGCSPP